jgi:hypothetical protein
MQFPRDKHMLILNQVERASHFVKVIVACPHRLPKLPESTLRKQARPNNGSLFCSHCDTLVFCCHQDILWLNGFHVVVSASFAIRLVHYPQSQHPSYTARQLLHSGLKMSKKSYSYCGPSHCGPSHCGPSHCDHSHCGPSQC